MKIKLITLLVAVLMIPAVLAGTVNRLVEPASPIVGEDVTVTIIVRPTVDDNKFVLEETFPTEADFVRSTGLRESNGVLRKALTDLSDLPASNSYSYVVTFTQAGSYNFEGNYVLRGIEQNSVGGVNSIVVSSASPPSPSPSPGPACTPDPGCGGQLSRCAGINAVTCTEQPPGCFVNSEVTTCQNGCSGGNCIVPRQEPERPNDQPRADPQSVVIPDDAQRASVVELLGVINDVNMLLVEKLSRVAEIVGEMLFSQQQ